MVLLPCYKVRQIEPDICFEEDVYIGLTKQKGRRVNIHFYFLILTFYLFPYHIQMIFLYQAWVLGC